MTRNLGPRASRLWKRATLGEAHSVKPAPGTGDRHGRLCHVPIDAPRFWAKVSAVEEGLLGCWPWLGALARSDGRALLHDPDLGRPTQAARLAWQLNHAPVPDGLQVLHLCDHPWCVRPTHLVLGSQAANMADRARKQWVHASCRP